MLRNSRGTLVILVCAAFVLLAATPAVAQSDTALERIEARSNNKPLGSLAAAAAQARARGPKAGPPREVMNFRGEGRPSSGGGGVSVPDAVLQTSPGDGATVVGSGFPGASNDDNGALLGFLIAPPDTDGSVGPNHYVQMINLLTTIYDKNGNIDVASFASNAFWDGLGGNCEPYNQGDPIILYDEQADRWLVSQFAFPDSMGSFSQCVAVSQTGDPAGAYNRYEFPFDGIGFNDYPKHGIVTDSITLMANLFTKRGRNFSWGGTYLGVMDKDAMYAGGPASLIGFNIGAGEFGFVAGDLDGLGTAPALFATAMSNANLFDIWQIDVDWSTEDASVSKIASIGVTPFDSDLCSASREACIPQPAGGPALEAIADRLMHRLQLRNFGGYRTMVTAHTIDVGGGRAGIRWYELRETSGTWSLYQEGTFGPDDGEHRFMPSAAMNAAGDIGIGYLLASTNTFVSTAATGQSAANSGSGFLDAEEIICAAGTDVQEGTGRSGDYSSTSVDPIADTFWHTNEVFITGGNFQWDTWVCEFSVGAGGPVNQPPTASFTYDCTDLACSFDGTGSSDDGTIEGYAWNFGDGGTATGATASHTFGESGTFTVTLTVTDDDNATDVDSQNVTVSDGANQAPTATFTYNCTGLGCDFTDTSTDDGTITAWTWNFGDGNTSFEQSPSHTYAADGTYTVTLTVTDDGDLTDSAQDDVTVTEPTNELPTAAFGFSCTDLDCSFDGSGSSDSDGSIVSYAWTFGDGNTGSDETTSHTYASAGTYNVTLTVTDDDGATDNDSQDVTVTEPGAGISLSADGYKIRGVRYVDLEWDGATGANVDVYRNGAPVTTTANDGAYTDNLGRNSGTYVYQVCEEDTSTCSNEATWTF